MSAPQSALAPSPARRGFAQPWLALVIAVALHVTDEALSGFLSVYNPTVLAVRARWPWFPAPVFSFPVWLSGLIGAVVLAAAATPLAAHNQRAFRVIAYLAAVLMMLNGFSHIAGTIAGRTFPGIRFPRPMPGFYSSPLLIAASCWLLCRLRKTRLIYR